MRILVISPTYLPIVGGAETGIYEIFRRLSKRHQIRILTPALSGLELKNQGEADPYYRESQLPVARFRDLLTTGKGGFKKLWQAWLPPISWSTALAAKKEIAEFKPDLINIHYLFPNSLVIKQIKRRTAIPVVLSLVGRSDVLSAENHLFQAHQSTMLKTINQADLVTALTKYMLGAHLFSDKIKVIPYGADLKRFHPEVGGSKIFKRFGLAPTDFVLFTLQRLSSLKRVDLLIQSLAELRAKLPNVKLIIGGKGPEIGNLLALTKSLNLSAEVFFAGFIPEAELPQYLAAARLFVFASQSETFGIVLAQALAAGKPIVAPYSPCLGEVLRANENALLVSENSPDAMARAILDLAQNPQRLEALSIKARRAAEKNYDWDLIAKNYEDLFINLVKKNAAA